MQRERNLGVLQACLLLPLSPPELHLMRTIAHHYASNTHQQWGLANLHREPEVAALFNKCQELLNVSQPAV